MGKVPDECLGKGPLFCKPGIICRDTVSTVVLDHFEEKLLDVRLGWTECGLGQEAGDFPSEFVLLRIRIDWLDRWSGWNPASFLRGELRGRPPLVDGTGLGGRQLELTAVRAGPLLRRRVFAY